MEWTEAGHGAWKLDGAEGVRIDLWREDGDDWLWQVSHFKPPNTRIIKAGCCGIELTIDQAKAKALECLGKP